VLRNQLTKWQNRRLVIKLRKGLYVLGELDRKITPSRMFLANQLYQPSYVSNEYALGFYDIIPERVYDITSVSSKKTVTFENEFGRFVYQHLKKEGFKGYKMVVDENGFNCFIAEPEKALMDYCYLKLLLFKTRPYIVFDSLRLQNLKFLKTRKIIAYAETFGSNALKDIAQSLISYIRKVRT
jgi:hypothetical protein